MDAEISTFATRKKQEPKGVSSIFLFLGLHSQSLGGLVWQDGQSVYHLPLSFSAQWSVSRICQSPSQRQWQAVGM